MSILLLLGQAEVVSLLQVVLNGGVPLILIVAVWFLGKFYLKEKDERAADSKEFQTKINQLQDDFVKKVELLYKDRLEAETENAKIIQRATEALESVNVALDKTNETLEALIEE